MPTLMNVVSLLAQINESPAIESHDAGIDFALFFGCCMILVLVIFLGFWIWMLIDCAVKEFPGDNDKIIWILVILLAGPLGALIYFFVGRPKGTKQ